MPVSHHIRPDGILVVERWGSPSASEEDAGIQARLLDEEVVPGMRVLVDSRRVWPADTSGVVIHLAGIARATATHLECGAVALVVSSDVGYGMARMYMALTELKHPSTNVFRDYEEALTWLRARPAAPSPGGAGDRP